MNTPEFIQVSHPARSESLIKNKNKDTEEDDDNESMSTNKDDEAQKDERKDYSLGKA
jgi:hypothetical protein